MGAAAGFDALGVAAGFGVFGAAADSGVLGAAAGFGALGVAAGFGVLGVAAGFGVLGVAAGFGVLGAAADFGVLGAAADFDAFGAGADFGALGAAAGFGAFGAAAGFGVFGAAAGFDTGGAGAGFLLSASKVNPAATMIRLAYTQPVKRVVRRIAIPPSIHSCGTPRIAPFRLHHVWNTWAQGGQAAPAFDTDKNRCAAKSESEYNTLPESPPGTWATAGNINSNCHTAEMTTR